MSDFRPQSFSLLPPIVKNLLIINVIVFLLDSSLMGFGINLRQHLALFYPESVFFRPWQYITYMFMHGSFLHLLFNMFMFWMFGYTLENVWGSKRFLFFFLFCGVGAALIHNLAVAYEVWDYRQVEDFARAIRTMNTPTVGASGSVYGILLAFGMMYPNMTVYVYLLFPVKVKYMVCFLALMALFSGFGGTGGNIAHFAHLGGMLFGFILIMYWRKHRRNDFY